MSNVRKSPIWVISEKVFKDKVSKSVSYKECLDKLGLTVRQYATLKKRIIEDKINIDHFVVSKSFGGFSKNIIDYLIEDSPYAIHSEMKKKLISQGLLNNHCYICNLGPSWCSKELKLQLDHINGKNRDNRLENLRLLCPNCHSQTDTYAGKNLKRSKIALYCVDCKSLITKYSKSGKCNKCVSVFSRKVRERPSLGELEELIKKLPFTSIGVKYGVSDNAVRKWAKSYGLDYKKHKRKN